MLTFDTHSISKGSSRISPLYVMNVRLKLPCWLSMQVHVMGMGTGRFGCCVYLLLMATLLVLSNKIHKRQTKLRKWNNWESTYICYWCQPYQCFSDFNQYSFVKGNKTIVKVSKSQKHFFLRLHCPKNERNIRQNSALWS